MVAVKVAVGDTVIYCREDYVGRVDEYPAIVRAVYGDHSVDLAAAMSFPAMNVDLTVAMSNAVINIDGIRYDPDGRPSSWHPKGK